jgi:hypothetical protein
MRLSLDVGYWGAEMRDDLPLVQEADRLESLLMAHPSV